MPGTGNETGRLPQQGKCRGSADLGGRRVWTSRGGNTSAGQSAAAICAHSVSETNKKVREGRFNWIPPFPNLALHASGRQVALLLPPATTKY